MFLVYYGTGEYEDYHEIDLGVVETEEEADKIVTKLINYNEYFRTRYKGDRHSFSYNKFIQKGFKIKGLNINISYTGVQFAYRELKELPALIRDM
jgi:hypothetical protein